MAETRAMNQPASVKWERRKRKLLPYAYLSPTLLLLAVLTVVPIVTVFLYSLGGQCHRHPRSANVRWPREL